jgi:hypothetical protein
LGTALPVHGRDGLDELTFSRLQPREIGRRDLPFRKQPTEDADEHGVLAGFIEARSD